MSLCCIQLSSVADNDSGSFVQVMETFQNIGPILDMSGGSRLTGTRLGKNECVFDYP